MNSIKRISTIVGAVLALSACGASPQVATTVPTASSAATASGAAAGSAKPSAAQSPSASPAVAARCDKAPKPFDANRIDLTGAWAGDDDGIYYLRQLGSDLWWNGMSERNGSASRLGRDWNNVATGKIDKLTIAVVWADVPRGDILGNGTMSLKIENDGTGNVRVVKVSETGSGFGNTVLTPCKPA